MRPYAEDLIIVRYVIRAGVAAEVFDKFFGRHGAVIIVSDYQSDGAVILRSRKEYIQLILIVICDKRRQKTRTEAAAYKAHNGYKVAG